jgi:hypothetical protein
MVTRRPVTAFVAGSYGDRLNKIGRRSMPPVIAVVISDSAQTMA